MPFFNHEEKVVEEPKKEIIEVEVESVKIKASVPHQADVYVLQLGSRYIETSPYNYISRMTIYEGKTVKDELRFTDDMFKAWTTDDLDKAMEVKEVYGCKILKLQLDKATEEVR